MAQEPRQQRGRGRTIDVVVAEDRDGLAAHHRVGKARRRRRHGGQRMRIGHQGAHGRIEKAVELVRRRRRARQ